MKGSDHCAWCGDSWCDECIEERQRLLHIKSMYDLLVGSLEMEERDSNRSWEKLLGEIETMASHQVIN